MLSKSACPPSAKGVSEQDANYLVRAYSPPASRQQVSCESLWQAAEATVGWNVQSTGFLVELALMPTSEAVPMGLTCCRGNMWGASWSNFVYQTPVPRAAIEQGITEDISINAAMGRTEISAI